MARGSAALMICPCFQFFDLEICRTDPCGLYLGDASRNTASGGRKADRNGQRSDYYHRTNPRSVSKFPIYALNRTHRRNKKTGTSGQIATSDFQTLVDLVIVRTLCAITGSNGPSVVRNPDVNRGHRFNSDCVIADWFYGEAGDSISIRRTLHPCSGGSAPKRRRPGEILIRQLPRIPHHLYFCRRIG